MDSIDELVQFLAPEGRKDIKSAACMTVAQMTGTHEGLCLLSSHQNALVAVMKLIFDPETFTAKDAMRILVNVSAEEAGASALLSLEEPEVVAEMLKCIEDKEYPHADFACGVLSNLSKPQPLCQMVLDRVNAGSLKLEGLTKILCQMDHNKKGAKLHLLAPVITNFSQLKDGRRQIMDKDGFVLHRILPFMSYEGAKGRRHAAVATVHNCCFDKVSHAWLLGEDVEVVGRLLLPLAGPDAFTEEENDSLPLDLQYLSDDKTREPDPEIRKLLLEALMQLCVTRQGRVRMREQNVYLILREHHKWEEDRNCLMLNEDVVNLLIRTEEEIGVDDLSSIDVPQDLAEKFISQDKKYLTGVGTS